MSAPERHVDALAPMPSRRPTAAPPGSAGGRGHAVSAQAVDTGVATGGEPPHPLAALVKNAVAVVESKTPAQVCELYRTVTACLETFLRSEHAAGAGAAPGAEAAQHVCFLLQCSAFLSLHALRPAAGGAAAPDAQGTSVDIAHVKAMADRVLEALEWAGAAGAASAAIEVSKREGGRKGGRKGGREGGHREFRFILRRVCRQAHLCHDIYMFCARLSVFV
jgi:hypothetical protein